MGDREADITISTPIQQRHWDAEQRSLQSMGEEQVGPRHRARLAPVGSAAKLFVHLCSADKKEKKIEIQTGGKKRKRPRVKRGVNSSRKASTAATVTQKSKCHEFFLQFLITEVLEKSCSCCSLLSSQDAKATSIACISFSLEQNIYSLGSKLSINLLSNSCLKKTIHLKAMIFPVNLSF